MTVTLVKSLLWRTCLPIGAEVIEVPVVDPRVKLCSVLSFKDRLRQNMVQGYAHSKGHTRLEGSEARRSYKAGAVAVVSAAIPPARRNAGR